MAAIEELDSDDGLTAGVLTGAGGGFSAGMDLKAFAAEGPPKGFNTSSSRTASQKPLIAAVEGFALAGGLEIALTCDLIVAAKGVKLGIPEVNKGLFAAGGGLFRLPARVPYGVAMEMALTSDPITAEQAHELGLVVATGRAGQVSRGGPRAGGAHREERPAGGGGEQAGHPPDPRCHRGGRLGAPGPAGGQGLHQRGRQGGPARLRREARAEVDGPLGARGSGR